MATAMKESDIRPEALFDEFLRLAQEDAGHYFLTVPLQRIACPGCGGQASVLAFEKYGFRYETCPDCDTLFVNPRPDLPAFQRYYQEAPSIKFWATNFYRETEEARRERIAKPRALTVVEKWTQYAAECRGVRRGWVSDVGAGYGVFCEELRNMAPDHMDLVAIEPSPALAAVCRGKQIRVVSQFLEEMRRDQLPVDLDGPGMLVSFELIEHVQDPVVFFQAAHRLLVPGDLLLLTTLNGLGLDIQVLWEKSKSVHPPHHVNFFNPRSIRRLLERLGFQVLEVTTPGRLDVSILENSAGKRLLDRSWTNLLKQLDAVGKERLQQFLQDHQLSSHMMVVARCR